jgi:hypothetical protein
MIRLCHGCDLEATEIEEIEAREITDLETEERSHRSKRIPFERFSNSTRARFAREGGRDLAEHTSTRHSRARVFREIPPSFQPAVRPAPRRILSAANWRSVAFGGSVPPCEIRGLDCLPPGPKNLLL